MDDRTGLKRPETDIDLMLDTQLDVLYMMKKYKDKPEYQTIKSRLVEICKDLNVMRLKEITEETDDEKI